MAAKVGGTLILAFLASIVLLAIIGVVSYRAVGTLISNNELVVHTQEVLEQVEGIHTTLLQIETDARGYLLTGLDVYKIAYENDLDEVPRRLKTLREKTQDNASHRDLGWKSSRAIPKVERAARVGADEVAADDVVERR